MHGGISRGRLVVRNRLLAGGPSIPSFNVCLHSARCYFLLILLGSVFFPSAACCRLSCGQVLRDAVLWQAPPSKKSSGASQGKIYYCNQVDPLMGMALFRSVSARLLLPRLGYGVLALRGASFETRHHSVPRTSFADALCRFVA